MPTTRATLASLLLLVAGSTLPVTAGPAAVAPLAATHVYLQVVAHPDDDLLFINPELQNALGAGFGSVTVVLTAAEADGGSTTADTSRAVFAGLRQQGLRAAYAAMVGVSNSWTRTSLWVAGHYVELDYLDAAPHVKLVFINLCDGGDSLYPLSLATLNADPGAVRYSFVPQGATVQVSYPYTHALLLQMLTELMTAYQPGHVNTLDPDPQLICGPVDPGHSCFEFLDDNPDHIAAAQFTNEALLSYAGPGNSHRFETLYHRGYAMSQYRGNLGANDYTRKRAICDVYKAYDSNFRLYENNYLGLFGCTVERYWGGTRWLQRMADGRLAAFAVQDRQVVSWTENSIGGTWTGPTRLGGGPVAPHVEVVRYGDGRLRLFTLGTPRDAGQHILTCVQVAPNDSFGPWQDIGCPDPFAAPDYQAWTGLPAAAVDAAGHAEVFARSASGAAGWCVQTAGGWSAWQLMPVAPGQDLQDGLAAILANDGWIDVFGAYRNGDGAHWRQQAGGGYALDGAFPVVNLIGPPTVTKNSDGRLEIFYREAGSAGPPPADVFTAFMTPAGVWSTNLVDLGGNGGLGPVASMLRTASGQIMLFERNDYDGVSSTWQASPNSSFTGVWQDLGGIISAFPAGAVDGSGRAVLAGVGTDGMLYLQREVALGSTGSFGGWFAVGEDPALAGVPPEAPPSGPPTLEARPNVTRSGSELRFDAPLRSPADLAIFDVSGRAVRRLAVDAAATAVRWDGRDRDGRRVPPGLYLVRGVFAGSVLGTRVVVLP